MSLLPSSACARTFQVRLHNRRPSREQLLHDLQRVAQAEGGRTLTQDTYSAKGEFAVNTVVARFGTWNAALKTAGLPVNIDRDLSDGELFENLAALWRTLGRQPIGRDLVKREGLSKFSVGAYEARFGTWNKALLAFAAFIDDDAHLREQSRESAAERGRLPRKINWRLRATVLIRDNCLCRMCGASPAKDPAVTLHVDHIVPWSKGGHTREDNLQTLCSVCNIGKGNLSQPVVASR
jgi:hypothetical protein